MTKGENSSDVLARVDLARLESVVSALLDAPIGQRARLAAEACGADADLHAAVLRLLEPDDAALDRRFAAGPLDSGDPLVSRDPEPSLEAPLPHQVGRYLIRRKLGEGGMGIVYEAEQENPRRIVALKMVRPWISSTATLRRFQKEAHALGQLQHPGIARIYEAGVQPADEGRPVPYYAMELVPGRPLDEYIRRQSPALRERLALFAMICDAVHYAHERGVIHRDLKPANILVVEEPRSGADAPVALPKIIDFGVARLGGDDLGATRQTDAGQILGTLAYMSPEQVSGSAEQVDARSDVYSLGVILYELAASRPPFNIRGVSFAEAVRIIREEEATRLSAVDVRLRGDIETIVGKAIDKSRERRYASAAELASDVRAYLHDQPIRARPSSAFYQLRKFARRNRGLVIGLAVAAVTLVIGTAASTTLAFRENAQRRRADERAIDADRQAAKAAAHEKQSRRLAYRASITAAASALQGAGLATARQALADAPPELRGWEHRFLSRLADRSEVRLTAHRGTPAFALSADDTRVATRDAAGALRVWDAGNGDLVREWPGADARQGPALDTGGQAVLWVDSDASLRCADVATGTERWALPGRMRLSPDAMHPDAARFVCSVEGTQTVLLVRVRDGEVLARLTRQGQPIDRAAMSPCGTWIITQDKSGVMHVLDARSGEVRERRNSWGGRFSRDGRVLLSRRPTQTGVEMELLSVPEFDVRARFRASEAREAAVDVEPGGDTVLIAEMSGALRLGRPETTASETLALAHPFMEDARFTRDATRVITAGNDGCVRIWNRQAPPAPLLRRAQPGDESFGGAVDRDRRRLVRVGWGVASVIDLVSGATVWRRSVSRQFLRATAWAPSGTSVAVAGQQGHVFVLQADTGAVERSIELQRCELVTALAWLAGEPKRLVAGFETGELVFLDLDSGKTAPLGRHQSPITCVALYPDGTRLASGSGDGLPGGDFGAFSSGRADSTVRVWDITRGQPLQVFTGHSGAVTCLAVSEDGQRVLSGSRDGRLLAWDSRSGQVTLNRPDLGAAIEAIVAGPGGDRVTVAIGGTVRLFDATQGDPILTLPVNPATAIHTLAFRPAGDELVASGREMALSSYSGASFPDIERARWIALTAAAFVDELQVRHETREALIAEVPRSISESRSSLSETVVREAERYVKALGDPAAPFASAAILAATPAEMPNSDRVRAYKKLRAACDALPDDWRLWPTLGLLQHRIGEHDAALVTLNQAMQAFMDNSETPPPTLPAGLALVNLAMGNRAAGASHLQVLRTIVTDAGSRPDPRAVRLLEECEDAFGECE